jgi:hypothetical protein
LEATKFWTDDAAVGQLELKDQFVCRALFARALVRSEAATGLKGDALVAGVLDALKCVQQGLEVALGDPRYLFLVGPGGCCWPRHRVPSPPSDEGSKCVG